MYQTGVPGVQGNANEPPDVLVQGSNWRCDRCIVPTGL